MRLATQPTRKQFAAFSGELRLSAFGEGLKRSPSQKELASVLHVTTRHLRRWESAEAAGNRPCSQPYTDADLWRLYQRRGRKGWDRAFATRSGLADVFERFDQIRFGDVAPGPKDDRSMMAAMMLRSIAAEGDETGARVDSLLLSEAPTSLALPAGVRTYVVCWDGFSRSRSICSTVAMRAGTSWRAASHRTL